MGLIGFFSGAIGWMVTGSPLGGLLGYVLGALFDGSANGRGTMHTGYTSYSNRASSSYGSYYSTETGRFADSNMQAGAARDNFIFSLLVLSSCVIKADGKIMHSEMEYVRRFFRVNFGEVAVNQANDILLQLFRQEVDLQGCGRQIADHMDYATRLQLLDYLVGIAKADGQVTDEEVQMLRQIARAMLLDVREADAMLNLGEDGIESAYKVLGISSDTSNDELKRAYKKLVLKNHPDRVAALGEDIRLKAEEKLKRINEAYEKVCKARGLG